MPARTRRRLRRASSGGLRATRPEHPAPWHASSSPPSAPRRAGSLAAPRGSPDRLPSGRPSRRPSRRQLSPELSRELSSGRSPEMSSQPSSPAGPTSSAGPTLPADIGEARGGHTHHPAVPACGGHRPPDRVAPDLHATWGRIPPCPLRASTTAPGRPPRPLPSPGRARRAAAPAPSSRTPSVLPPSTRQGRPPSRTPSRARSVSTSASWPRVSGSSRIPSRHWPRATGAGTGPSPWPGRHAARHRHGLRGGPRSPGRTRSSRRHGCRGDDRIAPGDLGAADVLPYRADDPNLVPGFTITGRGGRGPASRSGSWASAACGCCRSRVARPRPTAGTWAIGAAAGEAARHAGAPCSTCGYFLPLAGALRQPSASARTTGRPPTVGS